MLTQSLPRTTVGELIVSTIALPLDSLSPDMGDFQWETCIGTVDGWTDPIIWPRVRADVADPMGVKCGAIARHGHDLVVKLLNEGNDPWSIHPSTADLKAHMRAGK